MKRILVGAWRLAAGFAVPSKARNVRRMRARGERVDDFTIRTASALDVPALARLHVTTWNATYAPLLVKGPDHAVRERQWREVFARDAPGWFCLVVERPDGEMVAFAQGNASDHPDFGGQLNKIYVRREYQRMGIGRRLLGHVARRFRDHGINSMWLFGDARNPSSRVWRALGAIKTDPDPGTGNYGWRDLTDLAAFPDPAAERDFP